MFQENIEIIKNTFAEFKGTGMYVALFFIAMLYIYFKEEDKKKKCLFIYFPLIVLFVTLNPLFNKIVGKIFTESVYWRVYWLLPIGITIGYAIIKFISEQEEKSQKIVVTLSLLTILIVSGKCVYSKDNFDKVGNLYKLPDDAVLVAQLIEADDLENKKALVTENLTPYIRQVTANIDLTYRRRPEGYGADQLLQAMNSGNVKYVATYAINTKSNYVVFYKPVVLSEPMEDYGFEKLADTTFWSIYKYIGNEETRDLEN